MEIIATINIPAFLFIFLAFFPIVFIILYYLIFVKFSTLGGSWPRLSSTEFLYVLAGARTKILGLNEAVHSNRRLLGLATGSLLRPAMEGKRVQLHFTCHSFGDGERSPPSRKTSSCFALGPKHCLCPRRESNPHFWLRRPSFYPLNYEGYPRLWTFSQSFGRASILNPLVLALSKLRHGLSEEGSYEGFTF
jgi:hypothetical protein